MRRYADWVERLRKAVLEGRGETDPGLRRAAAARSSELGGQPGMPGGGVPGDLPEDLREYVDTVALHAHRITDEDVAGLRRAGYSEDQIFEVSISSALGAALARLECGLAALEGGEP